MTPPARVCANCGAPARPAFQAPPPELAPDLDLRPGEPTRSTIGRWTATCRSCGLSAPDLACPPAGSREAVNTDGYRALSGPGPARAVLRHAFLAEHAGERAEAADAVLQAAWLADDAATPQSAAEARTLRRRAAALWNGGNTVQDALRCLDALRRAGDADAATAQAARLLSRPDLSDTDAAVVRFQQALLGRGDTDRHLMSSALTPPARRPHVTHGRAPDPAPAPRSLWSRLLGR